MAAQARVEDNAAPLYDLRVPLDNEHGVLQSAGHQGRRRIVRNVSVGHAPALGQSHKRESDGDKCAGTRVCGEGRRPCGRGRSPQGAGAHRRRRGQVVQRVGTMPPFPRTPRGVCGAGATGRRQAGDVVRCP